MTEYNRDVESDVHIARCGLLQIEYTFHEDDAIVASREDNDKIDVSNAVQGVVIPALGETNHSLFAPDSRDVEIVTSSWQSL